MFGLPSFLEPTKREVGPLHAVAIAAAIRTLLVIGSALCTRAVYDIILRYNSFDSLVAIGLGMLLVIALDYLLRVLGTWLIEAAGQSYEVRVSDELFGRLMTSQDLKSADAVSLFGRINGVRDMWSGALVTSYVEIGSAVITMAVMFSIAPLGAAVAAVGIALLWLLTTHYQRQMTDTSGETENATARRQGLLVESILGREDLISCRAVDMTQAKMKVLSEKAAAAAGRQRQLGGMSITANGALQKLTSGGVMVATAMAVMLADGSTGSMVACMLLSGLLTTPVGTLAGNGMKMSVGKASADALRRFDVPAAARGAWIPKGEVPPTVSFEHVTVRFPGQNMPALRDVSFSASPGEVIAVVGPTGSGKSTLGRLIGGLLLPTEGHVRLAGTSTDAWNQDALLAFTHYCGQDPALFSDRNLADNIRLASPEATDAEVERALRTVGGGGLISGHAMGLARPISERAANLSGGQRRQITVARALLSNSRVLVLDESTANMDAATIQQYMLSLHRDGWLKGRTTFLITHGTELLHLAHRLIRIHDGQIKIENRKEIFRDDKLVDIQFVADAA